MGWISTPRIAHILKCLRLNSTNLDGLAISREGKQPPNPAKDSHEPRATSHFKNTVLLSGSNRKVQMDQKNVLVISNPMIAIPSVHSDI